MSRLSPNFVVAENDVLLAVAPDKAVLDQTSKILGQEAPGRLFKDRRDIDYLRVFASRPAVVGRAIRDLELPGEKGSVVLHVRRGDADLLALPDLVLEFGDRIGILANRGDFPALRKFFGDSFKEPSSSVTSPSASAWHSDSWLASSRFRFPVSGNLRWD